MSTLCFLCCSILSFLFSLFLSFCSNSLLSFVYLRSFLGFSFPFVIGLVFIVESICKIIINLINYYFIQMQLSESSYMQKTESQVSIQTVESPIQPRMKISITQKYNFKKILHINNYFILQADPKIFVYDILQKQLHEIPFPQGYQKADDAIVTIIPPYIVSIFINQFIFLYKEQALKDSRQIIKVKISKLELKCICKYNKGYFLGGFNRSPFPGKRVWANRQIYYMEKLNPQINNKPNRVIQLPNSQSPVSILLVQSPFIIAYCFPIVFLIFIESGQIRLKYQRNIIDLLVMQGRYAKNIVNEIGVSQEKNIFTADIQKEPIFGVQISQHKTRVTEICQTKTGRIYAFHQNNLFEYNPSLCFKTLVHMYSAKQTIVSIFCTNKNSLLALIKTEKEYLIDIFNIQ